MNTIKTQKLKIMPWMALKVFEAGDLSLGQLAK